MIMKRDGAVLMSHDAIEDLGKFLKNQLIASYPRPFAKSKLLFAHLLPAPEYSESAHITLKFGTRGEMVRIVLPYNPIIELHQMSFINLKEIYLPESDRGQGIFPYLIQILEHKAKELGLDGVMLYQAKRKMEERFLRRGYVREENPYDISSSNFYKVLAPNPV